jgi:hypothetical protein
MSEFDYLMPYEVLLSQVGLPGKPSEGAIQLSREQFLNLIRKLLRSVPFDEAWYLKAYPDIDVALKAGEIRSAREHFIDNGYFEGRQPQGVTVDEKFYLAKYPDVAEAIEFKEVNSAQDHFDRHGHAEGRVPYDLTFGRCVSCQEDSLE